MTIALRKNSLQHGRRTRGERFPNRWLAAVGAALVVSAGCGDGSGEALDVADEVLSVSDIGADGWAPNVVIGTQGADTGVYIIGGHREAPAGPSYESRNDSFRVELDGSVKSIAPPPIDRAVGAGSGVAVGGQLFALVQVCRAGGDPSSGGYGCVLADAELQFLRYDAESDEWSKLRLPPEIRNADPFAPPVLVPGRLAEGGPLYFALRSPDSFGLTEQILRFDPAIERWASVVEDLSGLAPSCTDGEFLYLFDRGHLTRQLAQAETEGPVVPIAAELLVFDADGRATTELVEVDYPVGAGTEPGDVTEVVPWCMRGGSLLVTVSLGDPQPGVSWPVRTSDGTWTATEPPARLIRQPFPWEAVTFDESVAFVVGEEESRGAGLPGFVFRVQSKDWSPLPSRPGAIVPQRQTTAGPSHIATFSPEPAKSGRGVTIVEVPK